MPTTPHRLQVGTDFNQAIPLLNENFDNVIQDIRDLGANLSTIGLYSITLPASSLQTVVFTLTSKGVVSNSIHQVFTKTPVSSVTGIAPQLDIYVDVDNDITYLYPVGSNLVSGQTKLFSDASTSLGGYSNSLAAWVIQLNNRDTVAHTYYVHTMCGYFPSGSTGIFK